MKKIYRFKGLSILSFFFKISIKREISSNKITHIQERYLDIKIFRRGGHFMRSHHPSLFTLYNLRFIGV